MATIIASIVFKFLDVDVICAIVAKAIACILSYASKKGGKAWDIAKAAILKINQWTSLFLQVYEDETLTPEEEKAIADAIKNQTSIDKLIDVLKKDKDAK